MFRFFTCCFKKKVQYVDDFEEIDKVIGAIRAGITSAGFIEVKKLKSNNIII